MEVGKVEDGSITLFGVRMRPNHIEKSHATNDTDTTLKLSNFAVEKKVKLASVSGNRFFHDASVCDPMPLCCFHEGLGFFSVEYFQGSQGSSHKGVEISGTPHDSDQTISEKKNQKRKNVGNLGGDEGKKRTKKGRVVSPEEQRIPSLDDISGLVEIIMSGDGTTTMPVFLYKKRLEASDVRPGLNRLMINERDKLMGFLKHEEISDFWNLKKGLKFSGIDSMGRVYELCLKTWPSLKTVVINSKGWNKLVLENKAEKGDWVRLWAYRRSGKFCLAVEFRKAEAAVKEAGSSSVDVASTSGTTTV